MCENKSNVPKLRFPGFTDAWEQRKLGEVAEFNPKATLPETFEYVDLESVVGADLMGHRTESKVTAPSRAQRLARCGDVFYQTVRPYQKNIYLFDSPCNDYVFSTGYAQMRPSIDSCFLLSRLQEDRFVKAVLDRCTGTSYPAVNATDLSEIEIMMPDNKTEQVKIGRLFRNFDRLITLHQRKLGHLQEQKTGLLQKMFPKDGETIPEIRFPGFTDAWEQRKLGDIATFINGRAYSKDELLDEGKYKVLRVGNFYTNDRWYYSDMELGEKYYANAGDLLYTWSATFGPHIWLGDKVIYHYHIWKVELSELLDKQFAVQILDYDKEKIMSDHNGSTMIHITKSGMQRKTISVPSLAEQKKVGSFFADFDNLITLHQRKLEHLQEQKKALLLQMFI